MPKPPTPRFSRCYVGIDPGQSGGIAVVAYDPNKNCFELTSAVPMPKTERDVYDGVEFCCNLSSAAAVEKVHSMPQQGVASSFKFGMGYGFLRGCLIARGITMEEFTPQYWQKFLRIPSRKKTETKSQFKNRLKAVAQRLFPKEGKSISLATADAILIAYTLASLREGKQ
jgi:crossover junction endodeoxyribonuclease RuvC